ncbi:MAG: twin-arginine translocase TatA/TatE family subunit [Bacteroidales bacterium]|nr:twin-arginine translocase TatA/TatE family subunit [Bacteroidales bacterium]MBK7173852.1 twin-arginine translocase TatA/TatE family subunit [Bacteroidales bacterium]
MNTTLLFLDISGGELLVIVLVVFLVFGPQKMPEIARKIGRAINEMKKASNDLTREFRQESSGIRSEIAAAQSKVKDEINSATQEVSKTRARVVKDLSVDNELKNNPTQQVPAPEPIEPVVDPPAPPEKSE